MNYDNTPATLLDVLDSGNSADTAILIADGPRLTYAELRSHVRALADRLAEHGLTRADRVATVFPNGAEAIIAFLGAAVAATAAPLNPSYTEDEFRFYLDDTNAKAMIVPPGAAAAARQAASAGMILVEMAVDGAGALRLESAAPRQVGRTASEPRSEDVALVLHTSGTTSRPKRVPLTHANLVASLGNIIATYELQPSDVALCVMPLFHVHGLMASTMSTFRAGGTLVVPPRFNPLGFWPLVKESRATWYSAVPTIHQLLLGPGRSRAAGRRGVVTLHPLLQFGAGARHHATARGALRRAGAGGVRHDRSLAPDGLKSAAARPPPARLGRPREPAFRSAS